MNPINANRSPTFADQSYNVGKIIIAVVYIYLQKAKGKRVSQLRKSGKERKSMWKRG